MTVLRAGSATDVGLVRSSNQDKLLLAGCLYAVADGMGGHAAGEVASDTAVRALEAWWDAATDREASTLETAAKVANTKVWQAAQADPNLRGMGTTLVAAALVGSGEQEELAVVNVGDSRAYLLRNGELEQLTTDHSLVAELVAEGQVPADEAEFHPQRHVLTRALGVDSEVPVDLMTMSPFRGDRLLLCSDGLIREVSDRHVASILRRLADPDEAARELVTEARMRGGNDNITVVVVDVLDDGDRAARASSALADAPGDGTTSLLAGAGKGAGADPTTAVPAARAPALMPPPSRRSRRRNGSSPAASRPRARVVTARVVLFFVVLLTVLGAAAAAVGWYGRGSYFVGLAGQQLTVYRGRPGGVLWIQPTVAERTGVTTAQVEARHLADLHSGVAEPSLGSARSYVTNLSHEYAQAQQAGGAPPA